MIVVSNRIQVAKGRESDFEKRFEGRARLVENMPGFIRLEILRPMKSDYYVVLTHWQDEASFRGWADSAEFKEAHILGAVSAPLGEFKEYLKSIPRDRPIVLY